MWLIFFSLESYIEKDPLEIRIPKSDSEKLRCLTQPIILSQNLIKKNRKSFRKN